MSNQVYSNDTTKYPVDASQLPSTVVTTDTAQSISGQKTFTTPMDISGVALDTTTLNMVCLNGSSLRYRNDIVTLSTTQTMVNKTLTSPVVTTATQTQLTSTVTGVDNATNVIVRLPDTLRYPKWTIQTVGIATGTVVLPVSVANPFTARSFMTGIVTLGPLLGNVLYREVSSIFTNTGASATWVLDFNPISANQNVGTNAATVTHVGGGTQISPAITGVAGNTIIWYGATQFIPN